MKNKCAKQEVIAIIKGNSGQFYIGSNSCDRPQEICPRADMPTGKGYELCKNICGQNNHAEINACKQAQNDAKGGTLYLMGHTYCCDNCKKIMNEYGINKIVIIPDEVK